MSNIYIKKNDTLQQLNLDSTEVEIGVGTVDTLPAGSNATVSATVDENNKALLNFGIPRGASASTEGLITYASEEQVVGTWTNGKPVYSRTYSIDNPKDGQIIDTISDFEEQVSLYGTFVIGGNPSVAIPFPLAAAYGSSGAGYRCYANLTELGVITLVILRWAPVNITFTVRYTKSTDLPGTVTPVVNDMIAVAATATSIPSGSEATVETTKTENGVHLAFGIPKGINAASEGTAVYTDEEVVVGTWFGKPLYRKVFIHEGNIADNTYISDTGDIESIIVQEGKFTFNGFQIGFPFYMDMYYVRCYVSNNNIIVRRAISTNTAVDLYAAISYTKTTDTTIGSDTTEEGEMIVDNWIDGRPIYRKRYIINNPTNDLVIDTIENLDFIYREYGFRRDSDTDGVPIPASLQSSTSGKGYCCWVAVRNSNELYLRLQVWVPIQVIVTIEYVKKATTEE